MGRVLARMQPFLQEMHGHDADGEMQDELQEMLLAIHCWIANLYKIDKCGKHKLYKMVEFLKEMRIMKTVRNRKPLQKMQRWIQNGGIDHAECFGCLRRRVFCRYGCNDHAWYEKLRNIEYRKLPLERLTGVFAYTSSLRRGRCLHRPGGTNRFFGNPRRIRTCPWGLTVGIDPYVPFGRAQKPARATARLEIRQGKRRLPAGSGTGRGDWPEGRRSYPAAQSAFAFAPGAGA